MVAVVVASSAAHPIGATGRLSVSDEFESHETSGMFDVRTGCDAPPARWRSRWPRRSETRRSVRPADADAFPASVARYCGVELSAIVSRLGSAHAPEYRSASGTASSSDFVKPV